MAKCDINNKQRLFDVLKSKDIVDMANDNNIEYRATLSGNILNISVKSGVDNAYIVQSLIENAVNNSFPGILLSSRTEDGYINTILFTERVNNTIKDKRNKRIAKLRFDRSIVRNDGEVISPSGYPAIPMANDRNGIIKNLEKQIHQEATNAWDLGEVADVSNRGVGKLINEYYKSDVVSYYDEGTDLTFPRVQVPGFLVDIYYNELLNIIKERKEKWSSDLMEQSSFWDENGDVDQYNSISTTNTNIAKEQYSQYLEQNPNGSIEQFKSWVDEFNNLDKKDYSLIRSISSLKEGDFIQEGGSVAKITNINEKTDNFDFVLIDDLNNVEKNNYKWYKDFFESGKHKIKKASKKNIEKFIKSEQILKAIYDKNKNFAKSTIGSRFTANFLGNTYPENEKLIEYLNNTKKINPIDVLKIIENTDSEFKYVAKIIKDIIINNNYEITITQNDSKEGVAGDYIDGKINMYIPFNDTQYTRVIIHELLHAISDNNQFQHKINKLYSYVTKFLKDNNIDYGLKNNREFLAEIFSNKVFQELMAQLEYAEPNQNKKLSVLDKFLELLSTFFKIENNSVLKEAFLILEDISKYNTLNSNNKNQELLWSKKLNELSDFISQKSQENNSFQQFQQSLNNPNTNPILQGNQKIEEFKGFWNRQQVASQPDKVFLFGDNTNDRTVTNYVPSATQAVIRGLPNAIGIDTKKDRGTSSNSYLKDSDFDWFKDHVDTQIQLVKDSGKTIVIPADGIGTGKAMLKEKAPKLFAYLQQELNKLKNNNTQQEQVKKFAELQEILNNKEFLEGAKNAFESSEELQNVYYEALGLKIDKSIGKDLLSIEENEIPKKEGESFSEMQARVKQNINIRKRIEIANKYNIKQGKLYSFSELENLLDSSIFDDDIYSDLRSILPQIAFRFGSLNKASKKINGYYDSTNNTINLEILHLPNLDFRRTLLHEIIHAATFINLGEDAILTDVQKTALNNLNNLIEELKKDRDFFGEYGLTNANELLAELANKNFVNKLKKKTFSDNQSFFEKIISEIVKLLGLNTTAYDIVKESFDSLVKEYRSINQITPQQKQEALNAYSSYIARVSLGIIKNPSSGEYNFYNYNSVENYLLKTNKIKKEC